MAILCVRIADNSSGDPDQDLFRTMPGDVVCIVPDDHQFSDGERNCGQYIFVTVTDAIEEDLSYLVAPMLGDDGETVLARYANTLDTATLSDGQILDTATITASVRAVPISTPPIKVPPPV